MPLYWIFSTIMVILFFMMMLKVYANYFMLIVKEIKEKSELSDKSWYW